MKKIEISIILSICIVFLLSGCTTVKVLSVQKKSNFSLADYKTYNFQVLELDVDTVPQNMKRIYLIRDELIKQLALSGLERSKENPDLIINVGLVVEEKIQTRETDFSTDAVYMGTRNYSWQSEEIEIGRYDEGTFTIDFVDTKDNVLKCMGVANGVKVKKDENAQKNIALGLEKLFKKINK
jgi:hypothetical protein